MSVVAVDKLAPFRSEKTVRAYSSDLKSSLNGILFVVSEKGIRFYRKLIRQLSGVSSYTSRGGHQENGYVNLLLAI
jgi:hypothetical protein